MLSNGNYVFVVEQSIKRRVRGTIALTHDAKESRVSKFKIIRLGKWKYQEIMIRREVERMQDELGKDELQQISLLINKNKARVFLRLIYFFRSLLNRVN